MTKSWSVIIIQNLLNRIALRLQWKKQCFSWLWVSCCSKPKAAYEFKTTIKLKDYLPNVEQLYEFNHQLTSSKNRAFTQNIKQLLYCQLLITLLKGSMAVPLLWLYPTNSELKAIPLPLHPCQQQDTVSLKKDRLPAFFLLFRLGKTERVRDGYGIPVHKVAENLAL